MQTPLFDQIINLITALARLAVPLVVLIFIFIYRKEISGILKKLKRGKIFGQEIELNDQLDILEESISESSKILPEPEKSSTEKKLPDKVHYEKFKKILDKGNKDPKEALYLQSLFVELELKNLSATYGHFQYFPRGFNFLRAVSVLENSGFISRSTASSLKHFYKLRNNIVHAQIETTEEDVIRLIDLGTMLLNLMRAIPRETYEVFELIDVFKDKECTQKHENTSGIILKVTSPGKKIVNYRIYPTTKTGYEKGQILSWEWNNKKSWGEAWYRSQITNKIEAAWGSSLEFIGRPLKTIPIESKE